MQVKKPTILVTNDDGIGANGIRILVEAMSEIGNVVVVAPDQPQSGSGHAITLRKSLKLKSVDVFDGIPAYECSGTPVDCVKLAVGKVLHKKPDLCVSGINHGSNSSINVIYSGTMSSAVEAAIEGIPSIGFSFTEFDESADMSVCERYVKLISEGMLKYGMPKGTLLNVNIPAKYKDEIRGIKICRQAIAKWEENYEERKDVNGEINYLLKGEFVNHDHGEDTDEWALSHGYVSIVPVQFDLTAHHGVTFINENWEF
jgi:5'-nucleotidase